MTLAGIPTAIEYEGISLVTTELAPMTHLSPILTSGKTITFCPIQHPSPIVIGPVCNCCAKNGISVSTDMP